MRELTKTSEGEAAAFGIEDPPTFPFYVATLQIPDLKCRNGHAACP